jgi:hypothetical protein
VDPVLGIIPPTPAEPVVEFSIAHLEYVAQCAQNAGVLLEVVTAANPGLIPIGRSTPRDDEIVGRYPEPLLKPTPSAGTVRESTMAIIWNAAGPSLERTPIVILTTATTMTRTAGNDAPIPFELSKRRHVVHLPHTGMVQL